MLKRRAAEREAAAGPAPHSGGPSQMLVVNDDPDACELLVRLLVRAGYPTERAHDHIAAIAQLTLLPPDGVVLDLATGGVGANLKLLDAIRTHHDPLVAAARVALIGRKTTNRMFSWQSGVDAFLVRPFHVDEFLTDVSDMLARPDDQRARHRRDELNRAEGH